jgi:hypothetical protein
MLLLTVTCCHSMPAPLVGMAGRLLLWLNTIELCLMSPLKISPRCTISPPSQEGQAPIREVNN